MEELILKSSNEFKINEFKRILGDQLKIEKGNDLPEVDSKVIDVIIYKSIAAGKNVIVEDTTLTIDGEEIVDIKWKVNELKNNNSLTPAIWKTYIAYNDGEYIRLYEGLVNGVIVPDSKDKGYGFDPYFLPDGSDVTLAVLAQEGNKDKFSARQKALINLISNRLFDRVEIKDIPEWNGKYQNQ